MKDLEKILDKIDSKLDKVENRLDSIDITLVKQEANLKEYIRRCDNIENHVSILEGKIEPIKTHVDRAEFIIMAVKWLGLPAVITGIIAMVQFYKG